MKAYLITLLVGSCIFLSCALPVTKTKEDKKKEEISTPESPDVETNLGYARYLKEVIEALESDADFRKKLDNAPEADIRNGKIAEELENVNHHVRSKLDEIKRRELVRLHELIKKKSDLENEVDLEHLKINQHLDHANNHTFEVRDLKMLIKQTSEDLAEADRKRRAEFKEYEMQKEFENERKKAELDEKQRKKFEEEQKTLKEKHKKHEKVHHPGNKAQLEDVWEKQDHLDKQDFDPRTFFLMHDVDGNGYWDETEVKALFVKELDKVYQSGVPEDDMRERAEEMERMREHVFQETDTNGDSLISFEEFIEQTKRDEYYKDPEWQTLEEQPQYTHEEYLEFDRRRKEEIERKIKQNLLPPHPNMPQGYYVHDPNSAYQTVPQHPPGSQQQPQMHYQSPQLQHVQQQEQYQQQQQQYHQQQYQGQQVQLNPNQVYQQIPVQQQYQQPQYQQQQQPVVNSLPLQQQQQPIAIQQQPVANNILQQQQPLANNNIPQQQQPINIAIPQQLNNNVQQQQNIPQKH